jgi:hypothetical protein
MQLKRTWLNGLLHQAMNIICIDLDVITLDGVRAWLRRFLPFTALIKAKGFRAEAESARIIMLLALALLKESPVPA